MAGALGSLLQQHNRDLTQARADEKQQSVQQTTTDSDKSDMLHGQTGYDGGYTYTGRINGLR